ncbi:MAG: hypothetical protein ABI855_06010 [Bacteroidota bacterium]
MFKIIIFIIIMLCIISIIIIAFEIPVGGNDVSRSARLYESNGRLKKKYLPIFIIGFLIGLILLWLNYTP